jgi:hypothetical protein
MLVRLDPPDAKTLPAVVIAWRRLDRSYRPAPWQDIVLDIAIALGVAQTLKTAASKMANGDTTGRQRPQPAFFVLGPQAPGIGSRATYYDAA